jgi:hypothetical protein
MTFERFHYNYSYITLITFLYNRPLDDTSTTQAVLRPEKSQERRANLPREGPGMVELCNVLNIKEYSENWGRKRSEKYFEPPIIAKLIYIVRLRSESAFWNIPVTTRVLLFIKDVLSDIWLGGGWMVNFKNWAPFLYGGPLKIFSCKQTFFSKM